MTKNIKDNFDDLIKYRLYRSVKDLLHPSISKRNISDYKIILDEGLLPIRVFYPKKVSNLEKVIIYIPGDGEITDSYGKYSMISKELAIKCNRVLIAVDYFDKTITFPDVYDDIYELVKYLYTELEKIGIKRENITLMGDSLGGLFINEINNKMIENKENFIDNCVSIYPLISIDYDNDKYESFETNSKYDLLTLNKCKSFVKTFGEDNLIKVLGYNNLDKYPKYLVITGDIDPLRDEGFEFFKRLNNSKYYSLESNTHGFLKNIKTMKNDVYDEINKFIDGE